MPLKRIPDLFSLVLVIMVFAQCQSKHQYHYPSDLEHGLINGPVIHLVTLQYETDSAAKEILIEKSIELFNEHGSSPSDTVYYLLNNEEEINVLYFNANTSLHEKVTTVNGKKRETMKGIYDENGKLIRLDLLNENDSLREYYVITELSEKGELQAARHYNARHQYLESFSNIYNDFTRIRAINYDTTGKVTYRDTVEVNDKKWPVRTISNTFSAGSVITDTTNYTYDSLDHYGNWLIRLTASSGTKLKKTIRTFTYRD